jgi:BRCA1-associated protein
MRGSSRAKPRPGRHVPGSATGQGHEHDHTARLSSSSGPNGSSPSDLSLQPLLAHLPGGTPAPHTSSGISEIGRGIVHLFKHAPPPTLIASLDAHPVGESSSAAQSRLASQAARNGKTGEGDGDEGGGWDGDRAEGEDGSLIAVLAVPAWMRPGDFLEWMGGWGGCLEGVRMIRCVAALTCRVEADC